jgi:hypothetical protein
MTDKPPSPPAIVPELSTPCPTVDQKTIGSKARHFFDPTPRQVNGSMVVDLATQPGRHYEIRRLTDIASGSSTLVAEIAGDGYIQHISTPANSGTLFVTLRRK